MSILWVSLKKFNANLLIRSISALLKPGESIADLENMTPENILMRWVNHHLSRGEKGGALIWDGNHNALSSNTSGDFVSNFGNDLSNSVAYINLINQIGGKDLNKLGAKAIKIKDNLERAGAMLKMAEKIGVKPIITANDVVHGDEKLNMAFLATLFNSVSQTIYFCICKPNIRASSVKIRLTKAYKMGCVFAMVVVSILPHAEFGPNDYQEDAPHFN